MKSMMIERILTNNAAVAIDETGREVIVLGSGIAFNKQAGSRIDQKKIDKMFTLSSRSMQEKFQEIVEKAPMEYVLLSEKIISQAKAILNREINDVIYIVLTDHIAGAIARHRRGVDLTNPMLWDIRHFYPDEYQVGKMALELIRETHGDQMIEDEAGFIALHFVNSQNGNKSISFAYDMTKLVREITDFVEDYFEIEFDPESLAYFRFVTHLKFFAQRIFQKAKKHEDTIENGMLELIQRQYNEAYQCTLKICAFIEQTYQYTVRDADIMYMSIHIARIDWETR